MSCRFETRERRAPPPPPHPREKTQAGTAIHKGNREQWALVQSVRICSRGISAGFEPQLVCLQN